jgi:hypothetical protein
VQDPKSQSRGGDNLEEVWERRELSSGQSDGRKCRNGKEDGGEGEEEGRVEGRK